MLPIRGLPSAELKFGKLDILSTLQQLYSKNHAGVRDYLVNTLYEMQHADVDFILPQLIHLYAQFEEASSISLADFFEHLAARSLHFTVKLVWLLQATEANVDTQLQRNKLQTLCKRCETAHVNAAIVYANNTAATKQLEAAQQASSSRSTNGTAQSDDTAGSAAASPLLVYRPTPDSTPPLLPLQPASPSQSAPIDESMDSSSATPIIKHPAASASPSYGSHDHESASLAGGILCGLSVTPALSSCTPSPTPLPTLPAFSPMSLPVLFTPSVVTLPANHNLTVHELFMLLSKHARSEYLTHELHMHSTLHKISTALKLIPREQRNTELRNMLSARIFVQGLYFPTQLSYSHNQHYRILQLLPQDSFVLNSRDKAPFMLNLEIAYNQAQVYDDNLFLAYKSEQQILQEALDSLQPSGLVRRESEVESLRSPQQLAQLLAESGQDEESKIDSESKKAVKVGTPPLQAVNMKRGSAVTQIIGNETDALPALDATAASTANDATVDATDTSTSSTDTPALAPLEIPATDPSQLAILRAQLVAASIPDYFTPYDSTPSAADPTAASHERTPSATISASPQHSATAAPNLTVPTPTSTTASSSPASTSNTLSTLPRSRSSAAAPLASPSTTTSTSNYYVQQKLRFPPTVQMKELPHDVFHYAFGESWDEKKERIRAASPYAAAEPGWDLISVIFKGGDDVRQEYLAMQLISLFDQIFQTANVPLWLRPYSVVVTAPDAGLIETIPNAISIDSLKKHIPNFTTLAEFFECYFGAKHTEKHTTAVRNFVESVAAYSLVTYLLQIKDRHNGNIMIDRDGHIIHIDFGFMLSNSPGGNWGFESSPFKLTNEYMQVMSGADSEFFNHFKALFTTGFLLLRAHAPRILTLLQCLVKGSHMPCFYQGEAAVSALRDRFCMSMNEEQCSQHCATLIEQSLNNWRTIRYDQYQYMVNSIY